MKSYFVNMPEDICYISDWSDFQSHLPQGKVIIDKGGCGCGGTDYFLKSSKPVILTSPRRPLICSKMNDDRYGNLFYFDRSNHKAFSVNQSIDLLNNYIKGEPIPKILVTYDSLPIVLDELNKNSNLHSFGIVVDEFTCIFTDVKMKGFEQLNLIRRLNALPNPVAYISATPINDKYLDMQPEFQNLPYLHLRWPKSRYSQVNVVRQKMRSTRSEVERIINEYKNRGFFCQTTVNGQPYYSKEAVFYLNSVRDIVAIVSKCGLSSKDTIVICGEDGENKQKLRKVGLNIGVFPSKKEYVPGKIPFIFVTSASFLGADHYSDNASIYIFADTHSKSLSLDISLDLPQIAGRCRNDNNPFKNEIYYFYKIDDKENIDEANAVLQSRYAETERIIEVLSNITDRNVLLKLATAQKVDKYQKDYSDVVCQADGTAKVTANNLAYIADLRAIEIKQEQYKSGYSIVSYLRNCGFTTSQTPQITCPDIMKSFFTEFNKDNDFARKMRYFISTMENNPELWEETEKYPSLEIFRNYCSILTPERVKVLGFKQASLDRELMAVQSEEGIRHRLLRVLAHGRCYSNAEIKDIVKKVYDDCGIRSAAKAKDIEKYIPTIENVRYTDSTGNRQYGYKYRVHVSAFIQITQTLQSDTLCVDEIFTLIQKGGFYQNFKDVIAKLRCLPPDHPDRNEIKRENLPVIMWQGIFEKRCDEGLVGLTSLMCIDIDHKALKLQQYWSALSQEPWVFAMFRSPSGDGLKVIVKTDVFDSAIYKNCYKQLEKFMYDKYRIESDKNCEPLSQGCFASYDPNIYVNMQAHSLHFTFDPAFEDAPRPIAQHTSRPNKAQSIIIPKANRTIKTLAIANNGVDDEKVIQILDIRWSNFPSNYQPGNRTKSVFAQAIELCKAGVEIEVAMDYLRTKFPDKVAAVKDWLETNVENAYKTCANEFATERKEYKNYSTYNH